MKLVWCFVLSVLAIVSVWYTYNFAVQFSAFAYALAATAEAVDIVVFIDYFLFPEIDTVAEIKNGNKAVAMLYIAIALIVGCAFMGAR